VAADNLLETCEDASVMSAELSELGNQINELALSNQADLNSTQGIFFIKQYKLCR
jgi:hypothetical protein